MSKKNKDMKKIIDKIKKGKNCAHTECGTSSPFVIAPIRSVSTSDCSLRVHSNMSPTVVLIERLGPALLTQKRHMRECDVLGSQDYFNVWLGIHFDRARVVD